MTEGEIGKGFCILEEGTLQVTHEGKILNEIDQKGAIFGELSELLMYKRNASIQAKTDAKVRFFDISLHEMVEKNPKFAVKMIRNLGRRLSRMNSIAVEGNVRNHILEEVENTSLSSPGEKRVRVLVVDDKPKILNQISELCLEKGWFAQSAYGVEDALVKSEKEEFSVIIISFSLPEEGAVELRRKLKTNPRAFRIPVVGMFVKGDSYAQRLASDAGFSYFLYKPINKVDAISALYEAMEMEVSDQFFEIKSETLRFVVPIELTEELLADLKKNFKHRIHDLINEGIDKIVVDVSSLSEVGEEEIEAVCEFAEEIEEVGNPFRIAFVAVGEDKEMWRNLDGCEEWKVCDSFSQAVEEL